MKTLWTKRFAQRTQGMRRSEVRELLKLTERPGMISFGGGLPAPELFPIARCEEACAKVLREAGADALQYSATEGYRPLREMIARHSQRYGLNVEADNVLITSGSQQALDLIGKIFIDPGDRVLVERPTYLGALQAWSSYQARYLSVSLDDEGARVDQFEDALRAGPKFIYALPNFQNPTGVTLSLARRRRLIELADHYGVPILEDDPYGQLRYEGEHLPSLVSLDAQFRSDADPYSGNVIYLSTFSKTLAPGLRIGWIIASNGVIDRLVQAKQGTDLHTSSFDQRVAYEMARGGFLDQHVRLIRRAYRERRDAMIAAMTEFFPRASHGRAPRAASSCGCGCLKASTPQTCCARRSRRTSRSWAAARSSWTDPDGTRRASISRTRRSNASARASGASARCFTGWCPRSSPRARCGF